ncbi:MAG: hypothetical protein ACHQ01_08280 [Candidatus Limnocylindrales bacterium]
MDIAEFRRLTVRVVTTRNKETPAFLKAFDLTPGTTSGWPKQTSADWRVWVSANDELRGAVGELEAFLGAEGSRAL